MPTMTIHSTGNPELDKKLGGGIPSGTLTLVEGASDSGKSVLTQQIVWGTLKQGQSIAVLTSENTVKSYVAQLESLRLSVSDRFLLGRLRVYPIRAGEEADGDELLGRLIRWIESRNDFDLIILDALTTLISQTEANKAVYFFERCKRLCDTGVSVVVVVHTYAFDAGTLVRIGSLCDAHLQLSTEKMGSKLVKMMEVSKIRGAQQATGNIVSFEVEPGWGMRLIPFSKARA